MSWMDTHEGQKRATFRPAFEPAALVRPKNAFQPDMAGGYGVPSVTGSRYDVVANEALEFFRGAIAALSASDTGALVLARRIGTAGKYRFWSLPEGIKTAAAWESATAAAVAARDAERAAAQAEANALAASTKEQRLAALFAAAATAGHTAPQAFGDSLVAQDNKGFEVMWTLVNGKACQGDTTNWMCWWLPAFTRATDCAGADWWREWSEADIAAGRARKAALKVGRVV